MTTEDTRPKLAVLGLGTMGRGMAGSALRNGIPTVVWNLELDRPGRWRIRGREVATSAADAVKGVDMVITMVTDTDAVISIAAGSRDAGGPSLWCCLGTDEHDRRRRHRHGERNSREGAPRRPPPRCARVRAARCQPSRGNWLSLPPARSRLGPSPNPSSTLSGNARSGSGQSGRVRA